MRNEGGYWFVVIKLTILGKESVTKKNPESFINKTFVVSWSTSDHDSQNVQMAGQIFEIKPESQYSLFYSFYRVLI